MRGRTLTVPASRISRPTVSVLRSQGWLNQVASMLPLWSLIVARTITIPRRKVRTWPISATTPRAVTGWPSGSMAIGTVCEKSS
jgi:hypothetical protein